MILFIFQTVNAKVFGIWTFASSAWRPEIAKDAQYSVTDAAMSCRISAQRESQQVEDRPSLAFSLICSKANRPLKVRNAIEKVEFLHDCEPQVQSS